MPRGLPPSPLEKMFLRKKLKLVGPIDVDLGKEFDELCRVLGIPVRDGAGKSKVQEKQNDNRGAG